MAWGLGFRGLGCRGLGVRVWGLGFRGLGSGFGVSGLGFEVKDEVFGFGIRVDARSRVLEFFLSCMPVQGLGSLGFAVGGLGSRVQGLWWLALRV